MTREVTVTVEMPDGTTYILPALNLSLDFHADVGRKPGSSRVEWDHYPEGDTWYLVARGMTSEVTRNVAPAQVGGEVADAAELEAS